jgi:hypothetical protein
MTALMEEMDWSVGRFGDARLAKRGAVVAARR